MGSLNKLKWNDINEHLILLHSKSGDYSFPMNEAIADVLKKLKTLLATTEYVCCNENGYYLGKYNYLSHIIKHYMRKASLKEVYRAHSLRHTFASHLVMRGEPIYSVSKLLGHRNVATTEQYSHLNPAIMKIDTKYF